MRPGVDVGASGAGAVRGDRGQAALRPGVDVGASGAGAVRGDRGQAALFVVIVAAVLLVVIGAAVAALGRTTVDRAQAQTAADAAALASLDGGRAAAERLAALNGAVVVSWRRGPGVDEVTVVVSVDGVEAIARATERP